MIEYRPSLSNHKIYLDIDGNSVKISANGYIGAVQMVINHGSNFNIELTDVDQTKLEFAFKSSINDNTTMIVLSKRNLSFIGETTGEYNITSHVVVTSDKAGSAIELLNSSTTITEVVDFRISKI